MSFKGYNFQSSFTQEHDSIFLSNLEANKPHQYNESCHKITLLSPSIRDYKLVKIPKISMATLSSL